MRKSFDLTLVIDEQEKRFQLTPNFRAIHEIESHEVHRGKDGSLMAILTRFSRRSPQVSDYVAVLHGCLRAQKITDVTADEIGDAIIEAGVTDFIPLCVGFLREALGVNEDDVKKTAPRKKKASAKK